MRLRIIAILVLALLLFTGCNTVSEKPSEPVTEETKGSETDAAEKPTEAKPTERPTEDNKGDSNDQENENDSNDQENENNSNDNEDQESEEKSVKILMIGNSFSEDTMQWMYQIAEDLGYEDIKLGNLVIGGCSLDKHATKAKGDLADYVYRVNTTGSWVKNENYKMSDALKSEDWDVVSLQQASGSSGIESTYSQLEYMIGYVKGFVPNAKIVWNMTWAYQQDSTHGDFSKYNSSQSVMYSSIVSTVKNKVLDNNDISVIVPNGTAIQNARTSYIGDKLTRDGFHLSLDFGRYIAGLTFFSAVTGKSIEGMTYKPSGVDEDMQKVAIESAMNAIAEPWKVTDSEYPTKPLFDADQYTAIDMEWTPLGYWHSTQDEKHHEIITNYSTKFYASKMFTKEELPVGSIIILQEGWKYRPEAWKDSGKLTTTRPKNVSLEMVTVTEEWWGDYINRAFNLSKTDESSLSDVPAEQIEAALTIYVPKK